MERKIKDYILIFLKGIAMGAADIVPGVSGGTIALISGIYEELINTIRSFNLKNLKKIFALKFSDFFYSININFLIALVGGIFLSAISLARILKHTLENYPVLIWSFFFGLILASAIVVTKRIKTWNYKTFIFLILGIIIAYFVTIISPTKTPDAYWFIFISGSISICAMILPGISGAFILLLLGKYEFIIDAISEFKIGIILTFASGAIIGLLSFSNVLSWLLKKYKDFTIAVLAGFMLGSLNKVWPWKFIKEEINSYGNLIKIEKNIFPDIIFEFSNDSLFLALIISLVGFFVIVFVDKITSNK